MHRRFAFPAIFPVSERMAACRAFVKHLICNLGRDDERISIWTQFQAFACFVALKRPCPMNIVHNELVNQWFINYHFSSIARSINDINGQE
jgi:hypothetical protein